MVTVGDRNDNQPLFSAPSYSSTHAESNPNDLVVATVTATDIDEGINGQVIYSIVGGNSQDVFYIDSSSVSRQTDLTRTNIMQYNYATSIYKQSILCLLLVLTGKIIPYLPRER